MLRGDRKNDEIFSQFGKCPLGQSLNLRYVYPVYPCDGSVSVTAFELSTRKKFGPSFAVAFFLIIFNLSLLSTPGIFCPFNFATFTPCLASYNVRQEPIYVFGC